MSDQTHQHLGIVGGYLLLVRTYADGTITAAIRDDGGWGPEVDLKSEAVA